MNKTAIGGFMTGAAFMYFADPNRGRRRRALTRDKVIAGWHDVANEFDKAQRDLRNRARGVISIARSLSGRADVDGPILVDRIRSRIGRAVRHPHAITVKAEGGGRIVLEGPVLEDEVEYLTKCVNSVPGVTHVVSRLEVHREPGNVSSLQGGVPRRQYSEFAQQNWTPVLRVGAGALAGAAFYTSFRNNCLLRWAAIAGGASLLARAVLNRPFRKIFGVGGGFDAVKFDKTIHIDAPVEEVFAYWAKFENFPKFMTHLKEVRDLGNGRSHWVAAGPAGISIPWDAEITEQRTNELLAWRSVPGSLVRTAGIVRFDKEADGSTRISLRMSYCPPAGVFGHALAYLFGTDPRSEIDDDMVRLKSLIEAGKTRAHGIKVRREEVGIA